MTLLELLKAVKDEKLDKQSLEAYHSQLSHLCADMYLEIAELEKAEATFIFQSDIETDIAKKRAWKASEKGQRLITLNAYVKATSKVLSSIKNRLYSVY